MGKEKPAEKEYQEFIDCLNRHGVDYMIIGAYAVMKHTKIGRATKDIDFWIKDSIENVKKIAAAIKDFIGIDVRPQDLLVKDEIYYIGRPPRRIDIFCNQATLNYDETSRRKEKDKFLDSEAYFIPIDDLIKLKKYYKSKENVDKYEKDIARLEATLALAKRKKSSNCAKDELLVNSQAGAKSYVARIAGIDPKYGFEREILAWARKDGTLAVKKELLKEGDAISLKIVRPGQDSKEAEEHFYLVQKDPQGAFELKEVVQKATRDTVKQVVEEAEAAGTGRRESAEEEAEKEKSAENIL